MDKKLVYLDNSATTKISPEALAKYNEVALSEVGNPSSLHTLGVMAERVIREAKTALLTSLSAKDYKVVFTASGTEANNLAIVGRALSKERYKKGAKIITTEGEHASVNSPLESLSAMGFKISKISTVGGKIDLEELKKELTADTVLVTAMMVNNETGALYDLKAVADLIKRSAPEAVLHIDATQSFMKMPINLKTIGADMMTVSSHKIHGPKGVGALIVSDALLKKKGLSPIILGGGQEGGLRSGTENVPAIAAFGQAVKTESAILSETEKKLREMRDYLIEKLTRTPALSQISITNPPVSAPHILNITLPKIKSETMLHYLSSENIFVSSGSACSSNSSHKSSALTAFGRSEGEADSSIRISLSRLNEKEDIDRLCEALETGLSRLARMR
jgi:cysteine desulfurase